jgi:Raf kinase inhibitor-like YbhB/YbcL family protein
LHSEEADMRPGTVLSWALLVLVSACFVALAGCSSEDVRRSQGGTSLDEPAPAPGVAKPAEIELSSTAFDPGGPIPARYTEDGDDVSPPLAWSGVPEGTKELALICDDPDAPSPASPAPTPWVHWVLYKVASDTQTLPEGLPKTARLDDRPGVLQGKNSWRTTGYRGPAPPRRSGTHRYVFKLYALDTQLSIEPDVDKTTLVSEMSGHVIGTGELIGTYER